jgi:uncharacterized protein with HEPN domain
MRDYQFYIQDILVAMNSIERFIAGMDRRAFEADDKTSSAVIRKLEVIGEAAKNIPDEVKTANPQVPWSEMAGMRDRLIHAYFGIDYGLVWTAIVDRIPKIKPLILEILGGNEL